MSAARARTSTDHGAVAVGQPLKNPLTARKARPKMPYDPFGDETHDEYRARIARERGEPIPEPVVTIEPPEAAPVPAPPNIGVQTATAKPGPKTRARKPARQKQESHRVERREPVTQNEHLWCIVKYRGLSPAERAVAYALHAYCYVTEDHTREAAEWWLADKAEVGRSTVRVASKRLVALGLFDRLDDGRGGHDKTNRAVYRPMVPAWHRWEAEGARAGGQI